MRLSERERETSRMGEGESVGELKPDRDLAQSKRDGENNFSVVSGSDLQGSRSKIISGIDLVYTTKKNFNLKRSHYFMTLRFCFWSLQARMKNKFCFSSSFFTNQAEGK